MQTLQHEMLDITDHEELMRLDGMFDQQYGEMFEEQPRTTWLLAEQAFPELEAQAGLDAVHFLGGLAVRGETGETIASRTPNNSSLMAAAQLAAIGDEQSRKVVSTNVITDVCERLFKAAHQTTVHMEMVNGQLQQDGRKVTDIHRNTLEHTVLIEEMMRRTKYELNNALLFERLHAAGVLQQYDAIVMSPSSTTMTLQQKRDYGLFIDTESCSIQHLRAEGDALTLETAFVAGKRTPTAERHDLAAIRTMTAERGIELAANDGSEVLQHVLLIPKDETTGVADVVKWYDDAAGGTFYGQEAPRQDYHQYAVKCEERARDFDGIVQSIVNQVIAEAHTFRTPLEAIMRLDELSEEYTVQRAVQDVSIDAAVFGETAAMHIQEARFFMERGEFARAEESLSMAQQTAESSSCPLFKGSESGGDSDDSSGSSTEGESEKKWGNCPYCNAKVFVDPCAKKISCYDCTATVVNGTIISKGNGGTNKRLADAEKRRSEKAAEARRMQEEQPEFAQEAAELLDTESQRQDQAAPVGALALADA